MNIIIILEILLANGILDPVELPRLLRAASKSVPQGGTEPVVLSGRLPVWAFAALVHLYHPRPWVGTFDPRLGGAVVVFSHVADITVGDVVPLDSAQRVECFFPTTD